MPYQWVWHAYGENEAKIHGKNKPQKSGRFEQRKTATVAQCPFFFLGHQVFQVFGNYSHLEYIPGTGAPKCMLANFRDTHEAQRFAVVM